MENISITPMPLYDVSNNMPELEAIPVENWVAGELAAREVLYWVWPTVESDDKRTQIIEFLQRLIGSENNPIIKVYSYGSVPLKAYLPHGDIDLTVVGPMDKAYGLSERVLKLLEGAQHNESAIFKITEINFIDAAQVQLFKCIVEGIAVDLSLNQLGGLCSLGFLELADTLIKKDHIFKRSIILIKAWFFYESRLLGASHGLISTYALEILILYIFCMYNDSLTNPLMVMYRFLEYYSQFDWDHYSISIYGPVENSSIDNVPVVNPMNHCLLGGESLRDYISTYQVPDFNPENSSFPLRFMNIIDPLKESNNLGKSVTLGNFFRIRSALRFGAQRLGEIMSLPSENVGAGIKKFFKETFHNSQLSPFETSWSSAHPFNEVASQDENHFHSNSSNGFLDVCESVAVDPDLDQLDGSNGYIDDCKCKAEDPNQLKGSNGLDDSESETISLPSLGEVSDSELYYEKEVPVEKYPADISDGEIVLESPIQEENDTSLNFIDLAGDYENIRNLLFGLDYHRFVSYWDALWVQEPRYPATLIWDQPDRWPVR